MTQMCKQVAVTITTAIDGKHCGPCQYKDDDSSPHGLWHICLLYGGGSNNEVGVSHAPQMRLEFGDGEWTDDSAPDALRCHQCMCAEIIGNKS